MLSDGDSMVGVGGRSDVLGGISSTVCGDKLRGVDGEGGRGGVSGMNGAGVDAHRGSQRVGGWRRRKWSEPHAASGTAG